MVLLKNTGAVLPLRKGNKIALFGKGQIDFIKGEDGSAEVYSEYTKNLIDGMLEKEDERKVILYHPLVDLYLENRELVLTDDIIERVSQDVEIAIITISRTSSEGTDRNSEKGDFYLSGEEADMIDRVNNSSIESIIVVLNVGSVIDTKWISNYPKIKAVLLAWQPGMEGGRAAADILCGDANPSGKLTDTFATSYEAYSSTLPEGCYNYEKISDLPQGRHLYWEENEVGTLLVNMTRVKGNGVKIDDINYAEKEALKQVFSVANYLQRNGFQNYILSHIGAQTGVRETNQIIGLYTLTEDDLVNTRKFPDVIAQTNYEIDIHSPDGQKTCDKRKLATYDIPYRCLLPKGVESQLVAGRAISATHVAMSSFRVQPTCYALGQAAGIAAAIAAEDGCSLSEISINKLHEILKSQGVDFE